MQVTAIIEAAIDCKNRKIDAQPEIMIPLVGTAKELAVLRDLTVETIERRASKPRSSPASSISPSAR